MPPTPNSRLLHSPKLCAICDSGTVRYDVIHLHFDNSGRLKLCEDCYEGLVNDKTPQQCGMCNRGAEYGTWRVKRFDTTMEVVAKKHQYVPDYWLFCEAHFRELTKKVESRPRQTRIFEFEGDTHRNYIDIEDILLPMSRGTDA